MPMSERVVTNPAKIDENWRVAVCSLMNLYLTMQRTMAASTPGGPTELLIYATVAVANVQRLMRERNIPKHLMGTDPVPREWVVPISRNAVATASGLPRETVRRHVARMIEAGLLVDDPRGGVSLPSGVIQQRNLEPFLEGMLTNFARSVDELLRIGVIQVQTD